VIETTIDGRYQIISRIAAGGMGEVFRARDSVLEREVALKMLHRTLATDDDFIDRFRREARSAGMLSHPNIVGVHDWGQAGDTYFMVMEFIRGPNLRTILGRMGPMQPAQAAEVTGQILSALEHAHRQGFVHRDVKPENVLLTLDGVAKVADFGLARALAESRVTTAPGTVTGTVQYLAPEQIQGEPADPRTDLYATGILLYELLVGKVPYSGETSVAIAYKHLRERVPMPSKANPMVPESLDRVVHAATERDREARIGDAAEMRRRIEAAHQDLPPASSLAELARSVPPVDEAPPDRAPTVTIPHTLAPKEKRRRFLGRVGRWLAILIVFAAAGWATWTYLIPHRTDAPELAGLTVAQAQARAEEAGLELAVREEVFSSDVGAGFVVAQDPPPGVRVDQGSTIRVVLSKGKELLPVPAVTGLPLGEARRALREARFELEVVRVFDDGVAENVVIAQNPSAETELEVGLAIELTVSKGPKPVAVPNLVGRAQEDAEALLVAASLQVETSEDFSNTIPRGSVISQTPPAGEEIAPGSTVSLVVSRGPREFPMPGVVGMTKEAATSRLTDLGMQVEAVQLPGSSGNTVVGQTPEAGERVRAGDPVTIFIGGG